MRKSIWLLLLLVVPAAAIEPTTRVLGNGIRLPDVWPPRLPALSADPMPVPYLTNRPEVIPIDVGRQLLVDDFLIESNTLHRIFHTATWHSNNPVLRPDKPWEQTGGHPTAMVFSDGVWYDPADRLYKMWYMGGYVGGTCYATSRDGIHWEKPALDVIAGKNVVLELSRDSGTVWLDLEEKDPQRRYKMFLYPHPVESGALKVFFSADGIHWGEPVARSGPCGDRSTVFYNPFRKVWVYSIRAGDRGRSRRYREGVDVVAAAQWQPDEPAIWVGADGLDPKSPDLNTRTELYNLDAIAYESLLIGLFSIWRGQPPDRPKPNDLVVGFSRDGFHWDRPNRAPFIGVSERKGDWNWGNIQSAGGCCLVVGDRLYFYVSGRAGVDNSSGSGVCATGLATLRRDGFASLATPKPLGSTDSPIPGAGWLTTRPVRFQGKHLFINAAIPRGELRVEVQDIQGHAIPPFTTGNCIPIQADSTRLLVRWKGDGELSSLAGRPVRFRFQLTDGELYAFWVSADASGASSGYVAAGGPEFTGPRDSAPAGQRERAETVFHVAPTGNDQNPGTRRKPFATLERAREALRTAGAGNARRVIVHPGSYEVRSTFTLDRRDSGTAARPVTWQAAAGGGVRLVGGRSVPASAWQGVPEAPVLERLDPTARGHVVALDLRALGVTNLPAFPVTYHGVPPGPELFFNGARMTLARWPNEGWATIARIVESGSRPRDGDQRGLAGSFEYAGDRPSRWRPTDGVWLQGYWCYDWYDEVIQVAALDPATRRIRLAAPHVYSLMQGNPSPRRYRALNVLEELDQPGEFVIDRGAGRLYLWPPADLKEAEITLATLDAPVVAIEDACHFTLEGFVIEAGLGNGIEVKGGSACRIVACEARNLRRLGIRVTGGTGHHVVSCDIHHTGQGGLVLGGGDRKTLTPAGHEAVDNHIWRFSEHQLTSAYGLSFDGVGSRAAHNLVHDAPHQAISVGGNDHVFEFNEVHHVCTETDDCGALYKGRNPSCRGNVIRFNYWHDIGSPMGHGNAAVYFDDGDGGDTVFGNVFVRCGEPGKGSFGTVFSHGGHDIRAENNIFVNCKRALGSAPWDDARWRDALKGGQDCFFPDKLLKEVDITRPPYTVRYPELVGYLDPPAGVPRENRARLNAFVRCGEASGGNWRLEPGTHWSTTEDPGFVNAAKGDYRLRQNAAVFRQLPGFQAVPFEKMGLRRKVKSHSGN